MPDDLREKAETAYLWARGNCGDSDHPPCKECMVDTLLAFASSVAAEAKLEGACQVWDAVLSLCRSGTPADGIQSIAIQNLSALRGLIVARRSRPEEPK